MKVEIEVMPSNFFFNEETWYTHKESKMPTKKPLLNVVWIQDNGAAIGQISTIDMIFDPIEEYVTIPEEVRLAVIEKYGNDLKQYYQENVTNE